jgi:hypothetical protein
MPVLANRSRGPKTSPSRVDPEVEALISVGSAESTRGGVCAGSRTSLADVNRPDDLACV